MSDKYTLIAAEYAANMAAPAASSGPHVDVPVDRRVEIRLLRWKIAAVRHRGTTGIPEGKIKEIFDDNDETYGYRRVHAELARQASRPPASSSAASARPGPGTLPGPQAQVATTQATDIGNPHLVKRDFTAAAPYRKLISDITEIRPGRKSLSRHRHRLLQQRSHRVGDGQPFPHPADHRAMQMAAKNHLLAENCIAHSDRGSNYTSHDYAELLDELGLSQSLGRTGICYYNAAAESFFATLKKELVYRTVYPTRDSAIRDIPRYIELRTIQCLHSANWPPSAGGPHEFLASQSVKHSSAVRNAAFHPHPWHPSRLWRPNRKDTAGMPHPGRPARYAEDLMAGHRSWPPDNARRPRR